MAENRTALIVGAGGGLSASLARRFARDGVRVALAARDAGKLASLAAETAARTYACDAAEADQVEALFESVTAELGQPDMVVYNPSYRARGPITELDPAEVEKVLKVCVFGAFLVAQAAARQMTARGSGAIFFTGASASIKGYANSSSFAMGKFGMRGLAQSLARELSPQNVHVAHFIIDGGILKGVDDPRAANRGPDGMLHPDDIAESYFNIWRQNRSAWTWEVELRPWVEKF